MPYRAPVRDIAFTLRHIVDFEGLARSFPDVTGDVVDQVLAEAGRFAEGVLAPLNWPGDRQGCHLDSAEVTTPRGFKEAWARFVEGGWNAVPFSPDHGGQGLPRTLALAVQEMWHGSNMAFGLCPLLTQGAIELLSDHGSEEQKALYLPRLVEGRWTGTMNLTESQAGSDVGGIKARAERAGDGTYRIFGTKIFITFGEHDMAENIIHLVLARLPDSPPGTRGISLFLVPKFLLKSDGTPGARNDVKCIGLEEKLGIHGSPTCVMSFGDSGGATGFLVGAENGGMRAMFTMMNNARLSVGLEGVGIAEAATQKAVAFAQERLQGKPFGLQHSLRDMVPIFHHSDVRRMLFTMKALTEAARAICYATARAIDDAVTANDSRAEELARGRENFLTPIAKAFSSDIGVDVASLGIQVHGGMGYVEETGAAQYLRDARIAPIYEGTNGIQAIDLVSRKLSLLGGSVADGIGEEIAANARALAGLADPRLQQIGRRLKEGERILAEALHYARARLQERPADALAGATPFLRLAGLVLGGHFLAKGARAAERMKAEAALAPFAEARIALAAFYADNLLPQASGLLPAVTAGSAILDSLAAAQLEP